MLRSTAPAVSPQSIVEPAPARRARALLTLFSLGNALLIAATALNHWFTDYDYLPPLENWSRATLVVVESLALVSPAWLLGLVISRFWPRAASIVGGLLVAITSALYLLDLLCWINVGQRLLAAHTMAVFWPILMHLTSYVTLSNSRALIKLAAGYFAAETALAALAMLLARTSTPGVIPPRRRAAAAVLLAGCVVPAALFMPGQTLRKQFDRHVDRHPLALTRVLDGWQRVLPDAGEWDRQRGRWTAQLLAMRSALVQRERDFARLAPVGPVQRSPDIVLVLAESVRHDAFDAFAAPHLSDLAALSLVPREHYSAGNGTEFGFFGLLFGLDPAFYPRAREQNWRPALPRLLKAAGYHCAFFGTGDLEYFGMEKWIKPDVFETIVLSEKRPYRERDAELIASAKKMLAREGEYARLKGTPVCSVLYLYTTHLDYDFGPEDEKFIPYAENVSLFTRPNADDQRLMRNRYRNSVHCLDRLLAPLIAEDRFVAVMGDHGESLGEDGTIFHAARLADSQLRTSLVLHVPGAEPRRLSASSFHVDVLPTLLEAIDLKLNVAGLLSGTSLLQPLDPRQVLSVRCHADETSILLPRVLPSDAGRAYLRIDLWKAQLEPLGFLNAQARWAAPARDEHDRYADTVNRWFANLSGSCNHEDVYQNPVPTLVACLSSSEPSVRLAAIEALVRLKTDDAQAHGALRGLVRHEDSATRRAAVRALTSLQSKH